MPWLFASPTASTPASLSDVSREGGARKAKALSAASPLLVMAVSRLTTATSAADSTGVIAARPPFSAARLTPSACTSPATATTNGPGVGRGSVLGVPLCGKATASPPSAPAPSCTPPAVTPPAGPG